MAFVVNGYPVNVKFFPDGTQNLTDFNESLRGLLTNYSEDFTLDPVTIGWTYENDSEVATLLYLTEHLRQVCGIQHLFLWMPYLPNARMDRVHNPGTEIFTLKYFAKFINSLQFENVYVLDVHSDVGMALLERVIPLPVAPLVDKVIRATSPDILFFPDAGAAKRYRSMFPKIPYLYGEKNRDWESGHINGYQLAKNPQDISVRGSKVLIIDDICSRGGTFYHAGNVLRAMDPKEVNLWVTHCENSIFAGKLLTSDSPIDKIYTTDTLHRAEHDKIITIPLSDVFVP